MRWRRATVFACPRTSSIPPVEDPALVAELAARGIVLEVCPSSNSCLGIYRDYAEHPLKVLIEAGVKVTVNYDDPPFFGTSLGREYQLARERIGLSEAALWQCTQDAIEAAAVTTDEPWERLGGATVRDAIGCGCAKSRGWSASRSTR